jgi:hypothetical protein
MTFPKKQTIPTFTVLSLLCIAMACSWGENFAHSFCISDLGSKEGFVSKGERTVNYSSLSHGAANRHMTSPFRPPTASPSSTTLNMAASTVKIPKSGKERTQQAISGVKAALSSPRDKSYPLLECEFPALEAQNKLGDGSLRSTQQAEVANLDFSIQLAKGLLPFPLFASFKVWLLTSTSASATFNAKAVKGTSGTQIVSCSLKDGLPDIAKDDVVVFVTPSGRADYTAAAQLCSGSITPKGVVIVNAFAKDPKSISPRATMAYFLKPLTYNSQIVGYLTRTYPGQWTTVDGLTQSILSSVTDEDILVRNTNTPDLRASSRLVQKAVDERAIRARNGL